MQLLPPIHMVYIAGKYRADTEVAVEYNVCEAECFGAVLLNAGYSVICPHSMTHGWERFGLPDEVFLRNGIVQLSRCDAMYVIPGWETSEGTKAEIAFAEKNHIPIFYDVNDLFALAENHSIE